MAEAQSYLGSFYHFLFFSLRLLYLKLYLMLAAAANQADACPLFSLDLPVSQAERNGIQSR